MIHGTYSDPKGSLHVKQVMANPDATHEHPITKAELLATKRFANNPETKETFKQVYDFLSTRPYGFETVFGYTHLIDTKMQLRKQVFDRDMPGAGLDEAETLALEYLIGGNFFSSTG